MNKVGAFAANPLISVLMPVYNSERYVAEAIESIQAQTYANWEFIIVDDGSADGSAAIVRRFAAQDSRIRPLFIAHGGAPHALNAGLDMVKGDLVARIDSDDIALPQRFAVQLAWMRQTGVDVCGSCLQRFGAENGLLWFPETHDAIRHELLFRVAMLQPALLLRADIIKAERYDEQAVFEDYELSTRLVLRYRTGNTPQVLLKHRCHSKQVHIVRAKAIAADFQKFSRRYFQELFPQATAADKAAVAHVAEQEALTSLDELALAGAWLLRLAETPDNFLRHRMARRWLMACRNSAHLGPACYRLYQRIAPQFGVAMPDQEVATMRLACALRLRHGSRLETVLSGLKQKAFEERYAAS